MSEAVVDDIVAVLPPLLQSLEALGFIARHLNPPDFDSVMEAAGGPDQALFAVRPRLADWPEAYKQFRVPLELLPGTIRVGVLQGAVGFRDRGVLVPEEINPADRTVWRHDPDLQHRPRQPGVAERDPGDRLKRRLR